MPDNKTLNVPKGVARGHILCCCAVVFVCFMLTCLNLFMLSSTRTAIRHLEQRIDGHPRNLQRQQLQQPPPPPQLPADAAALIQRELEQQLQQQQPVDDFILLAPGDLDNAWTTQTGRLLVPVGQPEQDDDGWKQMQVQLAEQTSQQQRHIENLHDKLSEQLRAREELQRDQQNLMREHHELSREHLREMAKQDRKLLKEKHRVLKQDARHQDELRRVQSEMEQLKKVVEAVKTLDPASSPAPQAVSADATAPLMDVSVITQDVRSVEPGRPTTEAPVTTTSEDTAAAGKPHPLDHIFSAVFGPGADPGSFFFPSYPVGAAKAEEERAPRERRDLKDLRDRRERRRERLVSRLGGRRRRHDKEDGPLMRIDDGKLVPLEPVNTPVVLPEAQSSARLRRLVRHG
ncbi:Reticulocyte-binding protein 2-like protein a [Frankliniella fusca]|uniref:Reticulocyte-binding protein 2-like protein a n=1 Tax=Frankliniella fusca TaxID=407009 RepID=A0AAE1LIN5_9NEOP|nr:Reticulocyte-binding protein 2-like protein a [Frankliniella fusca]